MKSILEQVSATYDRKGQRHPGWNRTAALGSLLLAASPLATAQQSSSSGSSPVLEEIIVTARFREENLQVAPIAITAVSAETLEAQSLTNVDDLGLVVPNANIRQQANIWGPNPTIGLRGVNTNEFIYTAEPGVGVYVDDIYHGTLTGSSMDLLDLERVEVLRGPQGTLFGKNSLGGAIRLISKTPQGNDTGYVDVTYGSSNRLDLKGSYDFALVPDKLFMRIAGVSKQIDGYQNRLDFTCQMIANGTPQLAGTFPSELPSNAQSDGNCKIGENGGSESNAARAMLRYLPTDDLEVNLAVDYSKTVAQPGADSLLTGHNPTDFFHVGYNNAVIEPTYSMRYDDNRFVTGDPFTTYANYDDPLTGKRWPTDQITDTWSASAKIDYDFTDNLHLKAIGGYRTYDSNWASDGDLIIFDLSTTLNLQTHEQTTFELQLSGLLFNDAIEWTVGGFYYDSKSELGGYVTFGAFDFFGVIPNFDQNDRFTTESNSAFAHVVFDVTEALSLNAGVRYTDETKTYAFDHTGYLTIDEPLEYGTDHVDWKASIDYKFSDSFMSYVMASTGFRSEGAQPRPFTANQLQPVEGEEMLAYEVGFKGDFFDRRLRVNLSAFRNDYDPRVTSRFGRSCNTADNPDPGPFYPISANCPAGTPMENTAGFFWINYFSAPGTAEGAELELTASPVDNLSINGSMGYYTYESDEKNPLEDGYIHPSVREQPKLSYSLGAQYNIVFAGGSSLIPRLDWFYQGERTNSDVRTEQLDPYHIVPAYDTVNARLTYISADAKWTASLSAENLFDDFYWIQIAPERGVDGVSTVYNRNGVPGRGREIAFSLRRNF